MRAHVGDGEQLPLAGHSFELRAAVPAEFDPGASDEILDRARDENFSWIGLFRDSGSDVHRDPPDLAVQDLAFPGVQACSNLESELADGLGDRTGAANRPRRAVEAREEAVARDIELGAPEANELAADEGVMALEEL